MGTSSHAYIIHNIPPFSIKTEPCTNKNLPMWRMTNLSYTPHPEWHLWVTKKASTMLYTIAEGRIKSVLCSNCGWGEFGVNNTSCMASLSPPNHQPLPITTPRGDTVLPSVYVKPKFIGLIFTSPILNVSCSDNIFNRRPSSTKQAICQPNFF